MTSDTEDAPRPRRRRRTPSEAEQEIIAAAEALLRERPFRDLTVDEVMRRTELSRPSFYVYFKDRHDLVLRVAQHIGAELMTFANRWLDGGHSGPAEVRESFEGVIPAFARHGPVLRALADAAADDPDVEQVYAALVQRFVDATRDHIAREVAAGRMLEVDPTETARALVWMCERYLLQVLGRPGGPPPAASAETLTRIYTRTLYGEEPPQR